MANVLPDKLTVLGGNKHFTSTKVLDTPMGNLPHTTVIAFKTLQALRVISIIILLVITLLYKTDW